MNAKETSESKIKEHLEIIGNRIGRTHIEIYIHAKTEVLAFVVMCKHKRIHANCQIQVPVNGNAL